MTSLCQRQSVNQESSSHSGSIRHYLFLMPTQAIIARPDDFVHFDYLFWNKEAYGYHLSVSSGTF